MRGEQEGGSDLHIVLMYEIEKLKLKGKRTAELVEFWMELTTRF